MVNKSGLFIVFEGIDGSGKSTQVKLLSRYLTSRGREVLELMEPTYGVWGKKIRDLIAGTEMPEAGYMLELFINDREDDVTRNILPALESGRVVLLDRYYYSNAAYQGAMGLNPEIILEENRKRRFPEPDRVYYIDLLPGTANDRISLRNKGLEKEIFEKQVFLERVREIYLSLKDHNFMVIDGSGSIEETFEAISRDFRELEYRK